MTSKTLTVKEEAYRRLRGLKREGESFSDVIMRLTGAGEDYTRGFGKWRGSREELEAVVEEGRERLDEEFEERESALS